MRTRLGAGPFGTIYLIGCGGGAGTNAFWTGLGHPPDRYSLPFFNTRGFRPVLLLTSKLR